MSIPEKTTAPTEQLVRSLQPDTQRMFLALRLQCNRLATSQDGVALVLALLTMLLISMLALFGGVSGQTELQVAKNEQDSKKALNIADAGVRHVLQLLANTGNGYSDGFNDELSNNGTGGALAVTGSTLTTLSDGNQYRFFPFGGSASTDGYYVRAVDNYDSDGNQNVDTDQRFIVISHGKFGSAEKVINALISPPMPCAITTGNYTDISGNTGASDLQINSLDGFGACVHSNGNLDIGGSSSFPDGASSSGGGTCNGNPDIAGGSCPEVLRNQPQRPLPNINPGQFAQWVVNLGRADPAGPYYILHTKNPPNGQNLTNATTRGGSSNTECWTTDTNPPATSRVGLCDETTSNIVPIPAGVSISGGVCTFNSNSMSPGIYYCDGQVGNQGQVGGTGVTIISRDKMSFTSQTNLTAFFSDSNPVAAATNSASNINSLGSGQIKTDGQTAMEMLRNIVMVTGEDLNFTGNNTTITGIILIHNEIYMTGGKTITGYLIAGDGLPAFTGDPHPVSLISQDVDHDTFLGNSTIKYENFGTALPLGPPVLRAWNDGQW